MKKLLLLSLLTYSSVFFCQTQLKSFDEVLTALKEGKNVKTVIHYSKFKLFSDGQEQPESPNAIGGMPISTYEYFDTSIFKGKRPSFIVKILSVASIIPIPSVRINSHNRVISYIII